MKVKQKLKYWSR